MVELIHNLNICNVCMSTDCHLLIHIQPGRDYEAFFKASAWGATGNKSSERHKPPDKPSVRPDRPRMPADNSRGKQTDKQHVSSDTTNGSERKIFPATDTSNDTRSELVK